MLARVVAVAVAVEAVEQLERAMAFPLALSKGELQFVVVLPAVALQTFLRLWMEIWWPVPNLSGQR